MANTTERKPNVTTSTTPPRGALVSIATTAIDVGDRSAQTVFGLIHDVRGELRTAVDQSLDAAENVFRGMFRVGKRVTARVDELAAELTASSERAVGSVIRGLRDTTRAAGELAATATAAAIAGDKTDSRTATAIA